MILMSYNLEELRAADIVDSANLAVEMENEANILLARQKAKEDFSVSKLTANGECHYCMRNIGDGELFCDDECQAEYVAEQDQMNRLRGMRANIDVSRFD